MRELRISKLKLDQLPDKDLLHQVVNRESFNKLYQTNHNLGRERVRERVQCIVDSDCLHDFLKEIRICYTGVVNSPLRKKTDTFNLYIMSLIELYYSNLSFTNSSRRIKAEELLCNPSAYLSYDWVLFASSLNRYYRYLLFEYLVLGYSLVDLAKRRYCTERTIHNHLKAILEELGH